MRRSILNIIYKFGQAWISLFLFVWPFAFFYTTMFLGCVLCPAFKSVFEMIKCVLHWWYFIRMYTFINTCHTCKRNIKFWFISIEEGHSRIRALINNILSFQNSRLLAAWNTKYRRLTLTRYVHCLPLAGRNFKLEIF